MQQREPATLTCHYHDLKISRRRVVGQFEFGGVLNLSSRARVNDPGLVGHMGLRRAGCLPKQEDDRSDDKEYDNYHECR